MTIKVLHVEDDSDIREITKLSLEMNCEFEVIQTENGMDAIEIAKSTTFDVFLLDMMMPVMDGSETLDRLKQLPKCAEIPAIFMTARVQEREQAEQRSLGCDDIIAKPFDPISLVDRVKAVLKR
jgi:DNA-binding response OmpR family regulator